jgi:hypothetical protein
MDEHYKKAVADLLYAIEQRDILAETVKVAPPETRAEGLRLLAEMDKKIDEGEQALAKEYEAFQTHARAQDDLRQMLKGKSESELAEIREYCRAHPGELDAVEKLLTEEFPAPKGH